MLEQHPKKNAGLVLNILPDSGLITSSDPGIGKCIYVSNENRGSSPLPPEGENPARINEPRANIK